MRRVTTFALVLSLVLAGAPAHGAEALLDREAYRARLDEAIERLGQRREPSREQASVLASEVASLVPSRVRVRAGDRVMDIDDRETARLIEAFAEARGGAERRVLRDELVAHLEAQRTAIGKVRGTVREDRELLVRIAREEGALPSEQGPLQGLVERIREWLLAWLARAGSSREASSGLRAIFYVALAASVLVVLFVGWYLVRALRPYSGRRAKRGVAAAVPEVRVTEAEIGLPADALAYADACAEQGDLREAVRALFGGTARSLAERGLITRERVLTTGEIVRRVRDSAVGGIAPHVESLAAIFEPAWYGHLPVDPDTYASARASYLALAKAIVEGA